MAQVERIDRNGSKHWVEYRCSKCGGSGNIPYYNYVDGGICYQCEGSGIHPYRWIERTPEYEAKLAERRAERMRNSAMQRNAEFLEKMGFDADGNAWLVLGNSYAIRESLKAQGAFYNEILGWHFAEEHEGCAMVNAENVYERDQYGAFFNELKQDGRQFVERAKFDAEDHPADYIFEVGDKVSIEAVLHHVGIYETHYTYHGEVHHIYSFKDDDGNVFVWDTQSYQDIEVGQRVSIKGTVKELDEYKGEKQHRLTRCRVAA